MNGIIIYKFQVLSIVHEIPFFIIILVEVHWINLFGGFKWGAIDNFIKLSLKLVFFFRQIRIPYVVNVFLFCNQFNFYILSADFKSTLCLQQSCPF